MEKKTLFEIPIYSMSNLIGGGISKNRNYTILTLVMDIPKKIHSIMYHVLVFRAAYGNIIKS